MQPKWYSIRLRPKLIQTTTGTKARRWGSKGTWFLLGESDSWETVFLFLQWCWLVSILYNVSIVLILRCDLSFSFCGCECSNFSFDCQCSPGCWQKSFVYFVSRRMPVFMLYLKIAMLVYWRVESGLVTKNHGDCEIVGIEITCQDIPERFFATSHWKNPCCRKIKRNLQPTKFIIDKKLPLWTSVY